MPFFFFSLSESSSQAVSPPVARRSVLASLPRSAEEAVVQKHRPSRPLTELRGGLWRPFRRSDRKGLPAETAGKLPTSTCRGVMRMLRQSTKLGLSQRWLHEQEGLNSL